VEWKQINDMRWNSWIITTAVLSIFGTGSPSRGDEAGDIIKDLRKQIEELDQKVRVLERKGELDKESSADKVTTAASVSAGANGFSIRSADTNFVLKLRAYIQADARFYADDHSAGTANDTLLMRRVRPILEGTVFEKYDFKLMLDFGSGVTASSANNSYVQEAYVNARFLPQLQVQFGKFKEPVDLERLQSGANLLFVERGYPTQLAPNRDVGLQLHGGFGGATGSSLLHYAVGAFNGVADGGSGDIETADDEKDVAVRIFAHPFINTKVDALRRFGIGVAGTYGDQEGALRSFSSVGQQRFFAVRTSADPATAPNVVANGVHWRLAPQGYYYFGPFGLFGEYIISSQDVQQAGAGAGAGAFAELRHTAWQVAASYFLTGEENSFKAVTPKKSFAPAKGGWGAWEIAARVGELDVDDDAFPIYASPTGSATKAFSWGVGLNWHFNKNVKVNLNYDQTDFKGGATTELFAKGEKAIFTRAQISF
jgi:phosphate-selective porin OprO/OprP